ncbi:MULTISPECIES: pyridoxamine 5'-phosphate oxidase [unclassified Carboxylicivirga]|uniref:pyridoxamine 5'-phosphate oxidase n=1 Tax=Carboxylicivirga TaxID=1628153 RepID=UPI003D3255D9
MNKLSDIRREYTKNTLSKELLDANPHRQFERWMEEALAAGSPEPTAMTLATVDAQGMPNCRVVLLKEVSPNGFVFFTNYNSTKGRELNDKAMAAMNFFWPEVERQVRIRGCIKRTTSDQSDAYFQTRPRASQLGALASDQSSVVENGKALSDRFNALEQQFNNRDIPRPAHWGGFILSPVSIEFWQGRANRMHDRFQYTLKEGQWVIEQLAP